MAKRQGTTIRDCDIVGLKYFDRLMPLLERLHDVGTQRDRAGNRQLFYDQYCAFILLFLTRLFEQAKSRADLSRRLQSFKGVGPVTARIFLRDIEGVLVRAKKSRQRRRSCV